MPTTLDIHFVSTGTDPYVMDSDTVTYICDGKEGSLRFNGHFYVEDNEFPLKMHLFVRRREKEPYKVDMEYNKTTQHHKIMEEHMFFIEIYKRIKHNSTDMYGPVDIGAEGQEDIQNVCFFPTQWQTIYFRILEVL